MKLKGTFQKISKWIWKTKKKLFQPRYQNLFQQLIQAKEDNEWFSKSDRSYLRTCIHNPWYQSQDFIKQIHQNINSF